MKSAAELVNKAKVVIFDCDDTVIATAKTRWKVLIATARSFGVTLTEDTIMRAWGIPFDRLLRTIVPTIDYDDFVARYRDAMRTSLPAPTKGATELLEHLAARSTRMEIVTSSSRDVIIQDLDALQLTAYFAQIYGYEQTRHHKPDPRVLDIIVDDLTQLISPADSVRPVK